MLMLAKPKEPHGSGSRRGAPPHQPRVGFDIATVAEVEGRELLARHVAGHQAGQAAGESAIDRVRRSLAEDRALGADGPTDGKDAGERDMVADGVA